MFHWWNEINQEDFICFELCSSTVPSRYYSKKGHLKDSIYFWMYILILAAQQQIISKCHICSSSCSGSKLQYDPTSTLLLYPTANPSTNSVSTVFRIYPQPKQFLSPPPWFKAPSSLAWNSTSLLVFLLSLLPLSKQRLGFPVVRW